jgi:hypothetical protein
MIIAESSVTLASVSSATSKREVSESLRAWVGDTRPDFENASRTNTPATGTLVSISNAGMTAQSNETQAINNVSDAVENDPKIQLLKLMIEYMTGRKISTINAADIASAGKARNVSSASTPSSQTATPQQAKPAGYGIEYDYHASYSETASMNFDASGVIRTADGQEINFDLSVAMQRSYSEQTNVRIREGDAKKVDPIVLNFSGNAAQLTDQKFSFDLDADGKKEDINFIQGGGFLTLDRNNDGKVNNGSELFGPTSGNGFAELSSLDSDGNNWIDENDAAYQQLQVWTKDAEGKDTLTSLKESHVGALYLGNVSSPFDIKDAQNQLQGQVRASGVWLTEEGQAQSMQQVDLVA